MKEKRVNHRIARLLVFGPVDAQRSQNQSKKDRDLGIQKDRLAAGNPMALEQRAKSAVVLSDEDFIVIEGSSAHCIITG